MILRQTELAFFTAPTGPASINHDADAADSVLHCLPALEPLLDSHDGFLVACYSRHPLVAALQRHLALRRIPKPVVGIFEASVAASLQLLGPGDRFGIVSTGRVWETLLSHAVLDFLGTGPGPGSCRRFAGVETTGLSAIELHHAALPEVQAKLHAAVARLLRKGSVGAICIGCAAMTNLADTVRQACIDELGADNGWRIHIVDGVQAGVAWLQGAIRAEW